MAGPKYVVLLVYPLDGGVDVDPRGLRVLRLIPTPPHSENPRTVTVGAPGVPLPIDDVVESAITRDHGPRHSPRVGPVSSGRP